MPDLMKVGQTLGAVYLGNRKTRFRVWAPLAEQIELRLLTPQERTIPMTRTGGGYWQALVEEAEPGCLYVYRLNGEKERPDPAARFQPDGVHGPSMVITPDFPWTDVGWAGIPLEQYVIYEIHIGTFTPEGTFEAAIQYLPGLTELGITAVEIMPVAQFPGPRNWGYDGVGLFAPQNSYGGPEGLHKLIDACHQAGLAVVLDVVYNHLGAEGNYLWDYGPYFTDRYKTPWGSAVNFDGPHSDDVRRYFIENAVYWLACYHVDALRLDAVHAILDFSGVTFLEELAGEVERQRACLGRRLYLIAESDLNNHRVVLSRERGGYGLDAQFSDDFHHAVHTLLTGESDGYYQDFVAQDGKPAVAYLAKVLREGYIYTGQYSRYRKRRHGNSPRAIPGYQFVVSLQNHDQVGNRMLGDRLASLVSFDRLKLAAGILLLAPFIPLLFMGEEYGETSPFQYFVSHTDADLLEAVRRGRRTEFADFLWEGEPPDPASEETFTRSKLCRQDAEAGGHCLLHDLYAELLRLRKSSPALRALSKEHLEVQSFEREGVLAWRRWAPDDDGRTALGAAGSMRQVLAAFNLGEAPTQVQLSLPTGHWRKLLDSAEPRWQGSTEFLAEPSGPVAARRFVGKLAVRRGQRTAIPAEQLESRGEVTVALAPSSFVLYAEGGQA